MHRMDHCCSMGGAPICPVSSHDYNSKVNIEKDFSAAYLLVFSGKPHQIIPTNNLFANWADQSFENEGCMLSFQLWQHALLHMHPARATPAALVSHSSQTTTKFQDRAKWKSTYQSLPLGNKRELSPGLSATSFPCTRGNRLLGRCRVQKASWRATFRADSFKFPIWMHLLGNQISTLETFSILNWIYLFIFFKKLQHKAANNTFSPLTAQIWQAAPHFVEPNPESYNNTSIVVFGFGCDDRYRACQMRMRSRL